MVLPKVCLRKPFAIFISSKQSGRIVSPKYGHQEQRIPNKSKNLSWSGYIVLINNLQTSELDKGILLFNQIQKFQWN